MESNSNTGDRGESPEPLAWGGSMGGQTAPANDPISLAERFRRERAGPQFLLFPEEMAYLDYRRYCLLVCVPPANFETWRTISKRIIP